MHTYSVCLLPFGERLSVERMKSAHFGGLYRCNYQCWWLEWCRFAKALIQEMWKKSTIALIAHRLSDLVPHLCQIISQRGEICPLWWPLTQSFAMLMTWMVQIRKLLMQEMWKKSTIALNAHILSKLAPNLCKNICWEDEICSVWWPLSLISSTLMT